MEYGGTVKIECEKTGYHTEIEFKLKVKSESSLYIWSENFSHAASNEKCEANIAEIDVQ
jgi:hypothetical protein